MLLLISPSTYTVDPQILADFQTLGLRLNKNTTTLPDFAENIQDTCDQMSVDLLFIATNKTRKTIKYYLKACRTLRIPYIFIDNTANTLLPQTILSPISFLEEEIEKAHYIAHIARHTNVNIQLMQAKDVGSKAKKNIEKLCIIFHKFNITPEIIQAQSNSFSIGKEGAQKANQEKIDLLVLLASRDYGLDDILFGPYELHAIRKCNSSVMLVNPRGDLYALCD